MKLQAFTADMMGARSAGIPSIALNRQGQISLNKAAVQLTGLKVGDKVALFQDEEEASNWYLGLSPQGFNLRTYKGNDGLAFNSAALVATVLNSIGLEETHSCSFKMAGEPTETGGGKYWGIITVQPMRQRVYTTADQDEEENDDN